ncbi:BgTH12-03240 [Blumeria graminis f. sp. triticale]|uniref:Xaa-Pro aminopeptidase n=1 Tax=Blumeria graminis f. sp. triticale TaxID=1689686 RepID=A0A9W4D935_BLUGR|nr:BgTH12-03240 [Blumeria graminis f. sp. triticale]
MRQWSIISHIGRQICPFARINVQARYPPRSLSQSRRLHYSISQRGPQFGQPVYETHPHILNPGEITPGISALEYSTRRAKLAASLPKDGVAILASSNTQYRSGAVFHEFHQDSNFFYLTGFKEPEAVAVIQKIGSFSSYKFSLFLRAKDAEAELWDGARSGEQAALDVFNADESGDIKNLHKLLPSIISEASIIYTDNSRILGCGSTFSRLDSNSNDIYSLIKDYRVKPIRPLMNNLRILKSEAEIRNMRSAGKASGQAFTNAMRLHWTKEKDLRAFLDYEFKINGCDNTAYVPVVAGGQNALVIHYVRNDDVLRSKEVVLVDAGGEYGGYITDITRSWPIRGKFTDSQKDLYEAILDVQRNCISLCRENANMTLDKIHQRAETGLKENLEQLGFDFSRYPLNSLFPHHVSHYIGLDVHDCPGHSRTENLIVGHCLTVEPGIYIPHNDVRWPKHYRGMGIRIEDSISVQYDSPLILTTEAVKEVDDIESLRD